MILLQIGPDITPSLSLTLWTMIRLPPAHVSCLSITTIQPFVLYSLKSVEPGFLRSKGGN